METKSYSLPIKKYSIIENNDDFLYVRLQIIKEGLNRNNSYFTLEGMQNCKDTFKQKPILASFPKDAEKGGYKLCSGHDSALKFDPDEDVLYYSYLDEGMEKCIGFIPDSEITIENIDGENWIVLEGCVWRQYNFELCKELLKKRNKGLTNKISVEISVMDSYEENSVEYLSAFCGDGVTILALDDSVEEGIEGANLRVYAQSENYAKFKKAMSFAYSKEKEENKLVFEKLSMNELRRAIQKELEKYTIPEGEWERYAYWIEDIMETTVLIYDCENETYCQVPYTIDESNNIILEIDKLIEVEIEYVPKNTYSDKSKILFISKDKLGTKDALKIDKSKASMSETAWGDVDKSTLKQDCFMASNWKAACKACFLQLSDGWEDGKEGSLGYPVMEIKDGTLVYNRGGLSAALGYATKNDETAVLSKINAIYKKLKLDKEKEDYMKKFIELAKKSGYSFLGLNGEKFVFSKEKVFEDDADKEEMCKMTAYEISEDDMKCAEEGSEEEFTEESFAEKALKMDDGDGDVDEEFEAKKKAMEDEKTALEADKSAFEEEKKSYEDAKKAVEEEGVKKEVEALMSEEDFGLEEKEVEELKTMSFATVDAFVKEVGFRKEMKRLHTKKANSLSFALAPEMKETKTDESAIDTLLNKLKK
jgi:hypothetical protein